MKRFNLRVYGLCLNDRQEILLSTEKRFGRSFIKFPGGGLEFGEGLKEALAREFVEELGLEVTVGDLFYVNDFCQLSAFNPDDQLLSFYYWVSIHPGQTLETVSIDYQHHEEGEKPVWLPIGELTPDVLTFPIDRVVGGKLLLR